MENFSPEYEELTRNNRDFADVLNDLSQSDMEIAKEHIEELQSHSLEYLIKQTEKQIQSRLEKGNYSVEITGAVSCIITMQRLKFSIVFSSDLFFPNLNINSTTEAMEIFNDKIKLQQKEAIQKQIDELTKKL